MLNELLQQQLGQYRNQRQSVAGESVAGESADNAASSGQADPHDRAIPYRQWAIGVRTLVRLRYLLLKKYLLIQLRQELEYEVEADEIQSGVLNQLRRQSRSASLWPFLLSRPTVYLFLTGLLLAAGLGIYQSITAAQEQAIFKQSLPEFSDQVYLLKAQQARLAASGADSEAEPQQALAAQSTEIELLRARIMEHFAGLPAIESALRAVLDGIEKPATTGAEMINRAKVFNDLLFNRRIPFYISLVSETAYCADLPSERFFARLFGGEQSGGDICHVHALTAFDLEESRYYAEQSDAHLALFTRRLDEQDLQDSFLGLVHIGDDRAQVRLSNIDNASADSLTAVSEGSLRSKLMPKGMPDVYGLESLARRLQSRVINGYVDDIERRWWTRIPSLWQELLGDKPDLLALAGNRLQDRLADVTAFHEVQHLVDQSADIVEPAWFGDALKPFGARVQNATLREHILWELSAFFTHLAYAKELQGVLLNDFTSITLNPMLQDQPHFYSIRLLLPALHQQLNGELGYGVEPARTLADVARAYKALATHSDDISRVAREAYKKLFGRPLPSLHEIRVAPRSTSRL